MRRLAAPLGVVLFFGALAAVVHATLRHDTVGTASAADAVVTPTIRSTLPDWRAPGGRFAVAGFAGARETVVLRANGQILATGRTGRLGRFDLAARAPARSALLTLSTARRRVTIGRLLVRPVVLAAVGDVTPGESVGPTVLERGAAFPWGEVGAVLRSADLTTANLEGSVSTRGTPVPNKEFHFRGPRTLLNGAARFAGIDVMTLANNHVMDYGTDALADTLAAARAAGIATVGAGATETAARRPVVLEAGGLRIAFLGWSDVNPLGFVATTTTPGTAKADVAAIDRAVLAARRRADLVVCWFHWGVELHAAPDERQRQFADACIGAGAKVVLGAHPHVLGAVERRGPGLVAWTLGNFVFPAGSSATVSTGILRVRLTASGVAGFTLTPAAAGVRPTLVQR